jgi:ubiquinone/menaquinone biosynthesis C-methylase UbiE
VDSLNRRKWDSAARTYDFMNGYGPERRWEPFKRRLFSMMWGKVLFVAIGTGQDIRYFPSRQNIVGVDISARMLDLARPRVDAYCGAIELRHVDVHDLDDPEGTYDQVFTSCTFCSVPDPVGALSVLRRVLRPGGQLHMFEHTGSHYFPFNAMLNLMSPLARRFGPELNRDTVVNVRRAGFEVRAVDPVYLDVVKMIHAVTPQQGVTGG